MFDNKLYILIGIPGSGKSTFSKNLSSFICEADNFPGLYTNGKLNFDKLETAHIYSRMCVEERMKEKSSTIVQANTNLILENIVPYIKLADKYNYKVHIILPKYGLLYFDGIRGRKRQIEHLKSVRNSIDILSEKKIPSKKMDNMIQKFEETYSIYKKLSKIHDPKELLKIF
jgi:hypothetical protein